ncbi:MAG: hypothetical protein A2W98_13600 [Bacteroidetes bacterium GWF2_33_38]|nr:MAG: hypothetical protein A2W98_13600 [Bacteroidetes bacterium GWF2_33_38]
MKKTIILITVLIFAFNILIKAQENPSDTTYFENGNIGKIKFEIGDRFSYGTIRNFKNSLVHDKTYNMLINS